MKSLFSLLLTSCVGIVFLSFLFIRGSYSVITEPTHLQRSLFSEDFLSNIVEEMKNDIRSSLKSSQENSDDTMMEEAIPQLEPIVLDPVWISETLHHLHLQLNEWLSGKTTTLHLNVDVREKKQQIETALDETMRSWYGTLPFCISEKQTDPCKEPNKTYDEYTKSISNNGENFQQIFRDIPDTIELVHPSFVADSDEQKNNGNQNILESMYTFRSVVRKLSTWGTIAFCVVCLLLFIGFITHQHPRRSGFRWVGRACISAALLSCSIGLLLWYGTQPLVTDFLKNSNSAISLSMGESIGVIVQQILRTIIRTQLLAVILMFGFGVLCWVIPGILPHREAGGPIIIRHK